MATVDMYLVDIQEPLTYTRARFQERETFDVDNFDRRQLERIYFQMRAVDTVVGGFYFWDVPNVPDLAGTEQTERVPANLTDIGVVGTYTAL